MASIVHRQASQATLRGLLSSMLEKTSVAAHMSFLPQFQSFKYSNKYQYQYQASRGFARKARGGVGNRSETAARQKNYVSANSKAWSFERIDLESLDLNDYDESDALEIARKGDEKLAKADGSDPAPLVAMDDIENSQRKFPIDKAEFQRYLLDLKAVLNVSHMSVYLWFCSESKIKEINKFELKEKYATDILSFCNHNFDSPEVFKNKKNPPSDSLLGDIVICPSYVDSVMKREIKSVQTKGSAADLTKGKTVHEKNELGFEESGISLCLSHETDLDSRLKLLLIHGMLHLLGHDHNKSRSWIMMTTRELDVVDLLKERGYSFKYKRSVPVHLNSGGSD
jgi:ssRNA-specific RNase YbeY (16S rRNA maturation enzyme)